jgi:hypothetical protein
MNGSSSINGYAKEEDVNYLIENVNTTIISDTKPEEVKEGQLWLDTSIEPYKLMIFTNGEWKYFSQKDGETIYINQPQSYKKGDLWIVNENDLYNSCPIIDENGTVLLEKLWNGEVAYYTKNGLAIDTIRYDGYQDIDNDAVGSYVTKEDGSLNYRIYTSYTKMPDPAIMYHPNFFGDGSLNINSRNDSITIYGANDEIICHQDTIKYYGSDSIATINANESSAELYLIYSNGIIYLLNTTSENTFFCGSVDSKTKHINGTLLKAIESSSTFNYDHWIDVSPEETTLQNNIYQTFRFDKKTGLKIGQADNKFYVNIDSQKMGFHSIDDKGKDVEVVHIGNNSATIQNATFEGDNDTTFNNNANFKLEMNIYKPNGTSGFTWKVEDNGSLSLVQMS